MNGLLLCLLTPGILIAQLGVTVQQKPGADSVITVLNYATSPLDAYVLSWEAPVTVSIHDALLEPTFKAVQPGKETTVTTRSSISGQPKILAGLFQDGVEYGERDWIAVLRLRRSFYVRAVEAYLAELKMSAEQNLNRAGLLEQIEATREQQLRLTPWLPGPQGEQASDMKRVMAAQPGSAWRFGVSGVYSFIEPFLAKEQASDEAASFNLQESVNLLINRLKDKKTALQQGIAVK